MPITDYCSKRVVSIPQNASIQEAAKKMREFNVGSLIVMEKTKKPIGIITDRDIVVSAVADGTISEKKVSDLMSRNPLRLDQSAGVADAIDKMERHGVRRAAVVNKKGQVCGMISTDDLVELLGVEINSLGKLMARKPPKERATAAWQ